MATMIVKTEVEATPELITTKLREYAALTANDQFPYAAGTMLILQPPFISAMGGVPDMPVIVIAAPKGTPLAMIGIYKIDGDMTAAFINRDQVQTALETQ